MKTPAERAHLLLPTTPASMEDKWRAAWSLLDEDKSPAVLPEHRLHARCWLTYRAFEGHVNRDEFMNRVRFCPTENIAPALCRWDTSICAAEFYVFTLWDMEIDAIKAFSSFQSTGWPLRHPPAVLSYLRMQTIRVYGYYLDGMQEDAAKVISAAVEQWKDIVKSLDWKVHPLRFLDGRGDMHALHALMCIAQKIGVIKNHPPLDLRTIQDLKDPWVFCMKHLSTRKSAIWK